MQPEWGEVREGEKERVYLHKKQGPISPLACTTLGDDMACHVRSIREMKWDGLFMHHLIRFWIQKCTFKIDGPN
jgi:hypothetical protein